MPYAAPGSGTAPGCRNGRPSSWSAGVSARAASISAGNRPSAIVPAMDALFGVEHGQDELRVFLEEAAGVTKYKERRKETEHRIADTREGCPLRSTTSNIFSTERSAALRITSVFGR